MYKISQVNKRALTICLIIIFCSLNPCKVIAQNKIIEEQLQLIDNEELDYFIKELNTKYGEYIPQYDIKDFTNSIRGSNSYDLIGLLRGIIKYVFREISANYYILAKLVAICIISAILKNFQNAFEESTISKITSSVVYLVIISIAIQSFSVALQIGKDAIEQMVTFMQAIMPTIFTILAAIGGLTSVAVLNPLIFSSVTLVASWIKNILLPIIFLTSVLSLVSNISEHYHVSSLASLLKQITVFLLGIFLSIFICAMVVHGKMAGIVDGITVRTAKFATKNFIPIVGNFFADAVDTIFGCSIILKNSVGLAGLVVIFILTIFPVIKILSVIFIYKLAGAVIQPIGEESIVRCLNDMGNSLMLIFVCVASVAIMFFIAITVVMTAGDITAIMR
jgi:stage III sporulation protein AE